MTAPVADALPYGARDLKLTQYADAVGTVLGDTSVDLPYLQHLNFTEAEEFSELRGDDKLITTRGRGSQVNWDIEAGGMNSACWAIITGGSVVETGVTPNRIVELKKRASASRPYFRIDGKIISDSGGDILVRIYRCRANGDITSNFTDGEFSTTQVSGVGMPLLDETNDLIYSIFRRETTSVVALTPDPNPIPTPQNLTVGTLATTSAELIWTAVTGATKYSVYTMTATDYASSHDFPDDWSKFSTEPTEATQSVTGLTADTNYKACVTATVSTHESDPSAEISFKTAAT